jgi:hypothetical protein
MVLANISLRPKSGPMPNEETGIQKIEMIPDLRRAIYRLTRTTDGRWQDSGSADWLLFRQLKYLRKIGLPIDVEKRLCGFRFRQRLKF